jgi:hypothetical protein
MAVYQNDLWLALFLGIGIDHGGPGSRGAHFPPRVEYTMFRTRLIRAATLRIVASDCRASRRAFRGMGVLLLLSR